MAELRYIIVQAGGLGTRLRPLTENKPKALVSVMGEPLLFRLINTHPDAHFIIIADYKNDILERYLKLFSKASYTIVSATGKHTCGGISQALTHIPKKTPFLISWCDLYYGRDVYPKNLDFHKHNYIGLSKDFPCRWMYKQGKFTEEKTTTHGVAGVFIFKDKNEIADVSQEGEFCKYLQSKGTLFKQFYLKDVTEVGTLEAYTAFTQSKANTRPFNDIVYTEHDAIKKPKNKQGRELAVLEKAWYKAVEKNKWDFIPVIRTYNPFILMRIKGDSLFKIKLNATQKKNILSEIITNLKTIHHSEVSKVGDMYENNKEAILDKTKKRLDSIISLVPFADKPTITINGKKCINFYKRWKLVEKMVEPYLHQNEYRLIHGDLTFSNIMHEFKTGKIYFIDPRGYYGKTKLIGDEDYDWAKLYYSIVGNYDQFNAKKFRVAYSSKSVDVETQSNGWEKLDTYFFRKVKRDEQKIKLFHAIIWLSLTAYAWDDYDSICGAFYKGIYYMQELYEKTL